jgi:hypothetical protein
MTVHVAEAGTIVLTGNCPVEDAETLVRFLQADTGAEVDWCACDQAHTAVVQVLLACGRSIRGPPRAIFLRKWIEPLLAAPVDSWPSECKA